MLDRSVLHCRSVAAAAMSIVCVITPGSGKADESYGSPRPTWQHTWINSFARIRIGSRDLTQII